MSAYPPRKWTGPWVDQITAEERDWLECGLSGAGPREPLTPTPTASQHDGAGHPDRRGVGKTRESRRAIKEIAGKVTRALLAALSGRKPARADCRDPHRAAPPAPAAADEPPTPPAYAASGPR